MLQSTPLESDYDDKRSVVMAEIMTPDNVNFGGNIHGGYLLSLLDKVAYVCATRYSGHYIVTLSVDQVLFKQPIHVGELVTCFASVNAVGRTSMEIGIKVVAENIMTRECRHTNSCYLTMVALDAQNKPTAIKPLEIHTPLQKRRYEEAMIRKKMRMKFREEHLNRKASLKEKHGE